MKKKKNISGCLNFFTPDFILFVAMYIMLNVVLYLFAFLKDVDHVMYKL